MCQTQNHASRHTCAALNPATVPRTCRLILVSRCGLAVPLLALFFVLFSTIRCCLLCSSQRSLLLPLRYRPISNPIDPPLDLHGLATLNVLSSLPYRLHRRLMRLVYVSFLSRHLLRRETCLTRDRLRQAHGTCGVIQRDHLLHPALLRTPECVRGSGDHRRRMLPRILILFAAARRIRFVRYRLQARGVPILVRVRTLTMSRLRAVKAIGERVAVLQRHAICRAV